MPAWLGWIAVVLLSLYLAVYPALAAALRGSWARESNGLGADVAAAWDHRVAPRDPVHRLSVESDA